MNTIVIRNLSSIIKELELKIVAIQNSKKVHLIELSTFTREGSTVIKMDFKYEKKYFSRLNIRGLMTAFLFPFDIQIEFPWKYFNTGEVSIYINYIPE